MVATGPTPGSTPISVPSTTPMKQYSRLIGVKATPKPIDRLVSRSMFFSLSTRDEGRPDRELQIEQAHEGPHRQGDEGHGEERVFLGVLLERQELVDHIGDGQEADHPAA